MIGTIDRPLTEAELAALGAFHEKSIPAVNASRVGTGVPPWGTPLPKPEGRFRRGEDE